MPLVAQEKMVPEADKDGVFLIADKMPEYPGGMNEMLKFLAQNIKYPVEAQKNSITGRVIVQFVVMEDGSLGMERVVRSVDPQLDAEALRVIKLMPKWIPGTVKGDPVKVRFTIPVMFRLNGDTPKPPRGFSIPIGQEITNKTLEGVWQSCTVEPGEKEYGVKLIPVLKVLASDKTFMNVFTGDNSVSAAILTQGTYKKTSDQTYVEVVKKTVIATFKAETKNEITFEFLNNNLVKFTFAIPGKEEPWTEYWYRIPAPGEGSMKKGMPSAASLNRNKGNQPDEKGVYMTADNLPEFPGGLSALSDYFSKSIVYPAEAKEKRISGRVIIRFVVMPDGTIDHEEIMRGIHPSLDSEAMRVIKAMPKWIPAELKGEKVPMYITTPVNFVL